MVASIVLYSKKL